MARAATTTELLGPGRHDLGDGAVVQLLPGAIADPGGDWMERLRAELPWTRHRITIHGRELESPRFSAWHGDPGAIYTYSRLRLEPAPWTPALLALRAQVEALCGARFNAVLANRYDHGSHSMGWHSDDEPELGPEPSIASLSFGSARRFVLRHRHDRARPRLACALGAGDLLLMAGRTQALWQHQLPKTARALGPRINLTFRHVRT